MRAGSGLARRLPPEFSRAVAERAAVAMSHLPPRPGRPDAWAVRRGLLARHLRRVLAAADPAVAASFAAAAGAPASASAAALGSTPDPAQVRRLVDAAVGSYAHYWADSLRLPGIDKATLDAGADYVGWAPVDAALDEGRGVIFALPHLGGWEWAGSQLARAGYKMSVVVERLHPDDLFEWFVGYREELGMEVIPAGPGAAARCSQALLDGHILCLLSDRLVAGTSGVDVDFFGEKTALPAGPATLALRTGAALFPVSVYFQERPGGHCGFVLPEIPAGRQRTGRRGRLRADVARMTQDLAHAFEQLISAAPTQWHLLQPNWPSDPGYPSPGVGITVSEPAAT